MASADPEFAEGTPLNELDSDCTTFTRRSLVCYNQVHEFQRLVEKSKDHTNENIESNLSH